MAYNYSPPPSGYPFYEHKPVRNDYSTPTPGYTYYDYKRNDATSPSGKFTYPYTGPYSAQAQHANGPSHRAHTRQAPYSSVAYINLDSPRPAYQADISPEASPNESHEKFSEMANKTPHLQKLMPSKKDSSAAAYSFKGPSPTISETNHAPWYPSSPLPRSYKPQLDRKMLDVYPHGLDNQSMQDVRKTISPKEMLLDEFDHAEEDAKTSLFTDSETSEVPVVTGGRRLDMNQTKKHFYMERLHRHRQREKFTDSGFGQGHLRKDSPGIPLSSTFKRQDGENRLKLTSVEPTTGGHSLLKAKQGLIGFANGSSITAMADTGSRKNVISASYAKKLDLKPEGLPSAFEIGNSRKIQSIGMYIYVYLCFFNGDLRLATVGFELTLNHLSFLRNCIS